MSATGKTRTFTETTFDDQVLRVEGPVVVDFWAPWCPPCRAIAPIVDQLAVEFDGVAVVGKVNVDDAPLLAQEFRISSIPTLLLFKGGKVVDRMVGAVSRQAIADTLAGLLPAGSVSGSQT